MCWGRGVCSLSSCNNEILWTDGSKVTWRRSDKYQLNGDIEQGDVTLTIIGATMDDTGKYCCRVEVPGLFNDLKEQTDVNREHVEHEDVLNDPRVALVYVPKESTLLHPKVTHKEIEEASPTEVKRTSTPEEAVEETKSLTIIEIAEINYSLIIRVTIVFSLAFMPLLIYSCIMKVNKG
ncbi:hepatitis A virus cellular receptor 1-like [Bufo gargarizans]|uniref:hepatitis A virus cellular receptor 1-like n=1 Tax=Bufo gargarizans TaxID=30331 RepID=UPI001CF44239|nr:hepatitis A virus cellular receptor 1-like [Bufo gargarizans]